MSDAIKAGILLALLSVSFLAGHRVANNSAAVAMAKHEAADAVKRADYEAKLAKASEEARQYEQDLATRVHQQAEKSERERADAQHTADRVIADLRSDNLRLRHEWQGCAARGADRVPGAAAGAGAADDDAELRAAGAGDIVRVGASCDAQVRGLQAILIEERRRQPGGE